MVFTKETLEHGIEKCKKNIIVFEDAIENERRTIKEYRDMIDKSEEQEAVRKEVRDNVHVEIVRE